MTKLKTSRIWSTLVVFALILSILPFAATQAQAAVPKNIELATGNPLSTPAVKGPYFNILDYGAEAYNDSAASDVGVINQAAIQAAIDAAHEAGGGTVIVPSGNFRTYTVYLKDNVRLHLESADSVIQAARSAMDSRNRAVDLNDGGVYDAPEAFFYARLQDQGHSHYKNSLIVGYQVKNIAISGPGLIDGSWVNESGKIINELSGSDVGAVGDRAVGGSANIANKAISIYDSENVFLTDFSMLNGGHFAIICEGVINLTVDKVLVDTNRDAFNVDNCQNVTITDSWFNSLTDDAIVLKADFGVGRYMRCENVLIEDCIVSGYDAGSVLYRTFTTDKLVATDRCGPTARIKLGTEGTGGFDRVTIRGVLFDRSRGLALEAVDCADLTNIVMTDCDMQNISSAPIFIRVGDRGRAPVTGTHTTTNATVPAENKIRLDNTNDWVLPTMEEQGTYPDYEVQRYVPSYSRSGNSVSVDNSSTNGTSYGNINIGIVNETTPAQKNGVNINILEEQGYDFAESSTDPNYGTEGYENPYYYANAVGGFEDRIAQVHGVYIGNVDIKNADPRYPITLAGLVDGKIYDVTLENIDVEYRGGLTMQDAVEQRQISTRWAYTQYMTNSGSQQPPWLANTFFLANEGLLPRLSWDDEVNDWVEDPYNIPERPREYPEPSNFGILPAWGLWARHVDGLTMKNVSFTCLVEDGRDVIVLDDVQDASITNCTGSGGATQNLTAVTNNYKRPTNLEYILEEPYFSTTVTDLTVSGGNLESQEVTVNAPEPGTPRDSQYIYATYPNAAAGELDEGNDYSYSFETKSSSADYSLPLTVHRPYFMELRDQTVLPGETLTFTAAVRDPAQPAEKNWRIEDHFLEQFADEEDVSLRDIELVSDLPDGAGFSTDEIPYVSPDNIASAASSTFEWTPTEDQTGAYQLTFMITDGLIPVYKTVNVYVGAAQVKSISPKGSSVSVGTSKFTVTFDREMDKLSAGTVTAGSAAVKNPVWNVEGTVLTYELSGLVAGKSYAVSVSGFKDVGAEEMTAYIGSFSTKSSSSNDSGTTPTTPTVPPVPDTKFEDVSADAWYADAVDFAVENGLFNGTSDTTFSPNANMTRAMFVTVLGRLAELRGKTVDGYSDSFTDVVPGSWYDKYAAWGSGNGIVNGYSETAFGPNDNVTREQMAALFIRFCDYAGITLRTDKDVTFADADDISGWALDAVNRVVAAGLMQGSDGRFNPRSPASRSEVAQLFANFAKLYGLK